MRDVSSRLQATPLNAPGTAAPVAVDSWLEEIAHLDRRLSNLLWSGRRHPGIFALPHPASGAPSRVLAAKMADRGDRAKRTGHRHVRCNLGSTMPLRLRRSGVNRPSRRL